jgi:hypothetical protein
MTKARPDPLDDLLPDIERLEALLRLAAFEPTPGDDRPTCGAYARSTGKPCQAPPRANGRCKLHGGKSTGPRTSEGRARIAEANRKRWSARRAPGFNR